MIGFFIKIFMRKLKMLLAMSKKLGERYLVKIQQQVKVTTARIGPFGAMVQIGEKQENPEAPKPKFALLKGQKIQTISLRSFRFI